MAARKKSKKKVKKKSTKSKKRVKKPALKRTVVSPPIVQKTPYKKPAVVSQTPYFATASYLAQIMNLVLVGVGAVVSIVIFLLSDKKFTKFHSLQATFLGFVISLLTFILKDGLVSDVPALSFMDNVVVYPLVGALVIVILVLLAFRTYKSQWIKLPLFGDLSMKFL